MPITLYKFDASPPARAVLMVAELLGLKIETQDVSTLTGDNYKPEYLEKNPLHTVPFLEDGDFTLADSHAIITYLVSKYGAEKRAVLYPSDLRIRATVDQRLFFDATILFSKVRSIVTEIFRKKATSPTEEQIAEVHEAYGFVENYLQLDLYLAGDGITLADISCVATISSLDSLVPLGDKYERVSEWWNRLKETEWYSKANAPGLAQMAGILKASMEKNASGSG